MEKVEYRSVIKFLHLKGKNNAEIKAELDGAYGESAPSLATVKFWKAEFVRGRTSVFDDDRPGRSNEVTTPETINKIHDKILADRRIKIREIAEALNLSTERAHNIIHQHLCMKKLSARWVPRLLTIKCAVAMAKLHQLGYELVDHPPYSPDLAASDFFLFPNLKNWLGGRRFASNDEVMTETSHYFSELQQNYFSEGIKKLETRLEKCIALKGDYVEK